MLHPPRGWNCSLTQDGAMRGRHSGPQGKVKPLTIVDDPADWKASDWEGREEEYTYRFTAEV